MMLVKDDSKSIFDADAEEEYSYTDEELKENVAWLDETFVIPYYETFLDFLDSVGSYLHLYKLRENSDNGTFIAQKICYEYDHPDSHIDQEVQDRDRYRWKKLKELDKASISAGFSPLSRKDKNVFMRFCEDSLRCRWLRARVKHFLKERELISIRDLVVARYKVEAKAARNKSKKGGVIST